MKQIFYLFLLVLLFSGCNKQKISVSKSPHNLSFNNLADSWDEAIPLGNGILGELVWRKGNILRFSLDRADLWDLRPITNLESPDWKYSWVFEQ